MDNIMKQSSNNSTPTEKKSLTIVSKLPKMYDCKLSGKRDVLNLELFNDVYNKSLNKFQLYQQTLLNDDPKSLIKFDLMKTQIFNIKTIDDNHTLIEFAIKLNNKFYYANCLFMFHLNYKKSMNKKSVIDLMIKKENFVESLAPDRLKNNRKFLESEIVRNFKTLFVTPTNKHAKNKNLFSVRQSLTQTWNKSQLDLINSYLNSIANYLQRYHNNIKLKNTHNSNADTI